MKHTVKEVVLKNGAKGLFIDIPGATVMSYRFHFRAGNRQVKSKDIYETAHIMEHMAFGANAKFENEHDYAAEFTKNGAYDNAFTSDNSMVYVANCADFEWDRILDLQELAICRPKFNQAKLDSEKGNVKNELSGMLSSHSNLLWPKLQQSIGEDVLTLPERLQTIDNITLDDIIEHHYRTHNLHNMRFVVAGKLHGKKAKLKQKLEKWKLKKGTLLDIPQDELRDYVEPTVIKRKDAKSLTFGFSFVLDRVMTDSEQRALNGLNHILTGTLHSRIFGKARDAGLVYSIFSDSDNNQYTSSWDFAGQVLPETAEQLFDVITKELVEVMSGKIKVKEIEATKSYGLGRYQMGAQTVDQISNFYTSTYFSKDKIRNYEKVPREIDRLDKDSMMEIATEFIKKGRFAFVMVGEIEQDTVDSIDLKLRGLKNE